MRFLLTGAVLLALCGCGGQRPEGPKLFKVTGKVTLDKKALQGASVSFLATGTTQANRAATASTDENGAYRLKTDSRDGLPEGTYKVVISKRINPDGSPPDPNIAPYLSKAYETLPATYSDYAQTTLAATVPEGGAAIDFDLHKSGK